MIHTKPCANTIAKPPPGEELMLDSYSQLIKWPFKWTEGGSESRTIGEHLWAFDTGSVEITNETIHWSVQPFANKNFRAQVPKPAQESWEKLQRQQ